MQLYRPTFISLQTCIYLIQRPFCDSIYLERSWSAINITPPAVYGCSRAKRINNEHPSRISCSISSRTQQSYFYIYIILYCSVCLNKLGQFHRQIKCDFNNHTELYIWMTLSISRIYTIKWHATYYFRSNIPWFLGRIVPFFGNTFHIKSHHPHHIRRKAIFVLRRGIRSRWESSQISKRKHTVGDRRNFDLMC